MMMTSALRRAALVCPQGLAIASGGERRTWSQTVDRIARLAGALQEMGVRSGSHVATLALNSPRYFELLLSVWWTGGVVVPLNTRLAWDEIRFILRHSDASLLLSDEHFRSASDHARAEASLAGLRVAVMDDPTYERMLLSPPAADACRALDELAGIFYTGGTTGRPKGVELTHENFAFAAMNMQRDLRHDERTVYLHAAPLFHLADFGIGLGTTLGAGAHSFIAQFSTSVFFERLRTDGVTHLQLVPTMLSMVLDAAERDNSLLAQIRPISYGAAPISQPLLERLLAAFPNARIQQFYGMTECCGACVMLPDDCHSLTAKPQRILAAGQPIVGFEVRIADVGGDQSLPSGGVGEIQMRGPAVMRGYWKDPERTAETLQGGWLRSGDGGRMDEDGFFYVVDRLKDMVISGGENIYCAEVESALATHPGVAACAVIGLPDDHWGERVHAVVVMQEEQVVEQASLDRHIRGLIAGYKVPRSYDLRYTPLPLSAVGKVQKNVLRDQHLSRGSDR